MRKNISLCPTAAPVNKAKLGRPAPIHSCKTSLVNTIFINLFEGQGILFIIRALKVYFIFTETCL
jgi:hypothetical protein